MTAITMERFNVKNLDCPSCAAKIERGLSEVDGVDEAILDFANLTLHVKARDIKRIIEEVKRIEPDVELEPKSKNTVVHGHTEESHGFNIKRELYD